MSKSPRLVVPLGLSAGRSSLATCTRTASGRGSAMRLLMVSVAVAAFGCVSATGSEEVGSPTRRAQDTAGAAGAQAQGGAGNTTQTGDAGTGGDQGQGATGGSGEAGSGSDLPGTGGSPFEDPGGAGGTDDPGGAGGDPGGAGEAGVSGAGGVGDAGGSPSAGAGGSSGGQAGTSSGGAGAGGMPEGDCPRVRVVVDPANYVNLRADPSTANAPVGKLYNGDVLTCVDQVQGQSIDGNTLWFKLDSAKGKGFISATLGVCTKDPL